MGLPRRVQNLILDSPFCGAKWLRSIDLTHQLFGNTTPLPDRSESAVVLDSTSQTMASSACRHNKKQAVAVASAGLEMERIRLSRPIFRFQSTTPPNCCTIDCFPLAGKMVAMADRNARVFLCDAETRRVVPMPNLHKPKSEPISLFVPNADADDDHPSGGGSLYVMERYPNPFECDGTQPSDQFEVFVPSKPSGTSGDLWHCRLLPAPPFVGNPDYWYTNPPVITSYTVLGSHICISTKRRAVTYCLDTKSNTWEVVRGMLPFYGKVEYVPELKLWFGLSNKTRNLAAADLWTMDSRSRPELIGDWKEFDAPVDWMEYDDSHIVNHDRIVVFTGVEVARVVHNGNCSGSGNGKVELQMKKHKSRCHMCNATTISDVF